MGTQYRANRSVKVFDEENDFFPRGYFPKIKYIELFCFSTKKEIKYLFISRVKVISCN